MFRCARAGPISMRPLAPRSSRARALLLGALMLDVRAGPQLALATATVASACATALTKSVCT